MFYLFISYAAATIRPRHDEEGRSAPEHAVERYCNYQLSGTVLFHSGLPDGTQHRIERLGTDTCCRAGDGRFRQGQRRA